MNRPARKPAEPLALQDAKARFSEVVAAAMGGQAQHVTRRGKPAVVIVSATEFERLRARQEGPADDFIAFLRSMPYDAGHAKALQKRPPLKPRDIDFGT